MSKIFLAVGHGVSMDGTWDSGCVYGNDTEANLMYSIAGAAVQTLRQYGVEVVTDYDTKNDRNCTYTIRDANAAGVDIYISLHCDYDKAPSGTYPIVYPGSDTGMRLANCVNASVMLRMGIGTRGVLQRDDMEVANTNMTACIFETGSICADNAVLKRFNEYGFAVACGIMDYLGVQYTGAAAAPVPTAQPTQPDQPAAYEWDTTNIQYALNICNYGAPDIDGVYGSDTENCVKNAQRAYGIAVDGDAGTDTINHLSGQVLEYQKKLIAAGYAIDADGVAGPATYNTVKQFQAAHGLETDGIIGAQTFAALMGSNSTATAKPVTELKNFEPDEFKCECGCGGDIKQTLKLKIQQMRDILGAPIVITSGFRCPHQNNKDGGVSDSLHLSGDACDLYTPGMTAAKVDQLAAIAQQVGLGTIRYYTSRFVHVQLYPRDTVGD